MKKYLILIILFFVGLIGSAINCHDYYTWVLEVFPGVIGFFVLLFTFRRFRFTYLTYVFILAHCYILFIGGHYTYALVPAGEWLKEALHQSRNNYDKLGHFFQGFVPAIITRELFIRSQVFKKNGWIPFLTVCVCCTISMLYEFIEWFVSVTSGSSGDSFLGTQGDIWDTQSDMLAATIGATCMVLLLSKIHDRQIGKIQAV
jgi:putative membrane protein